MADLDLLCPPRPGRLLLLVGALASLLLFPSVSSAAPLVTSTWATDVSATSATLHAEANPNGQATRYRFEYLTEAAYLANAETFAGAAQAPPGSEPNLGSEAADQPAVQQISGLQPATAYRYRIAATNAVPETAFGQALAFTTQPGAGGAPEACPNSQLRSEDNSLALPDCRAYELVSPPEKEGGAVAAPGTLFGGAVLQAAAGGEAATFSSAASFGEGALGAPPASQYLATRTASGWSTENLTPPTASGAYGDHPEGVPYQLFSTDLASAVMLNGARCALAEQCPRSYSLRDNRTAALTPSPARPDLRLAGATPDLRHLVLSTCAKLTPEATEEPSCESAGPNLYEWSEGVLRLVNLLGSNALGTSDAHLAAQVGAISTDGSRVYFTDGEDGFLYLREGEAGARLVSEGGSFQAASADGRFAFYTKGGELFRYDAQAETSEQLSAEVQGVLGASEDGSRVYYASAAGLFFWSSPGTIADVAAGAAAAQSSDWPPATGTARVSADGTHLAFLSRARLTGYDNTDQSTAEADSEVYLYGAAGGGALTCVSCNPTAERPLGPSTIPGSSPNGTGPEATDSYKPRVLSAQGTRLFFDSSDKVLPADASQAPDVYEWQAPGQGPLAAPCTTSSPDFSPPNAGCLAIISSGASGEASTFIDASEDGRDALFLTAASLVPVDPGSADLYDARELGGFPMPSAPTSCEGDACQPLPSPPEDPAPATLVPGPSNPPPHYAKPGKHKKHRKRHRHHHKRDRR